MELGYTFSLPTNATPSIMISLKSARSHSHVVFFVCSTRRRISRKSRKISKARSRFLEEFQKPILCTKRAVELMIRMNRLHVLTIFLFSTLMQKYQTFFKFIERDRDKYLKIDLCRRSLAFVSTQAYARKIACPFQD